jgi:hypothetical protein
VFGLVGEAIPPFPAGQNLLFEQKAWHLSWFSGEVILMESCLKIRSLDRRNVAIM